MSKKRAVSKITKDTSIDIFDTLLGVAIGIAPVRTISKRYSDIKAELFEEKVNVFLENMGNVTAKDQKAFLKKIEGNSIEFFKRLWSVLDRIDEKEKAVILGKLFRATIMSRITLKDFLRMCNAIDSLLLEYLNKLSNFHNPSNSLGNGARDNQTGEKQLASFGLLLERIELKKQKIINPPPFFTYQISELGAKLVENGL